MNDPLLTSFSLSDRAIQRLTHLLTEETEAGSFLRIAVQGGGCSGFQYIFSFDTLVTPDDCVFEKEAAKVVIDEASLNLLKGSQLDYQEDLMGATFVIKNPNAVSGCGCGNSFAIF